MNGTSVLNFPVDKAPGLGIESIRALGVRFGKLHEVPPPSPALL